MDSRLKIITLILLSSLAIPGMTDIYRYQDANGDWHYTDKVNGKTKNKAALKEPATKQRKIIKDLASKLEKKYKPNTAIERSTLSVVKVKTNMGSGSGFFISENGYLITNKHVVRPAKYKKAESDRSDAKAKQKFQDQKKRYADYRKRLKKRKLYLDKSKAKLKLYSGDVLAAEKQEYQAYLSEYRQKKRTFQRNESEFNKNFQSFERAQSKKRVDYANSNLARHFKIYLKDRTEVVAELIEMSDKHDLALLKVHGYKTPYIKLSANKKARQGHRVYAIGSPLGMDDHMTSGIVTSLKKYRLVTDAKIFPGNSGGPLVNDDGIVLGVNTQKMVRRGNTTLGEGFGIAITKAAIEEEFAYAIDAKEKEKPEEKLEEEPEISPEEKESQQMMKDIMEQYRQNAEN